MNASDTSNVQDTGNVVETTDPTDEPTDDVETTDAATDDVEPGETTDEPEMDLTTGDGIQMALASFGDATIAEKDLPVVVELEAEVRKSAGTLAQYAGKMLKVRKDLAKIAVRIMPLVSKAQSGLPDWDGTSKGFHLLFDDVIESALQAIGTSKETQIQKQERKNLLGSIRGHVRRTYLEPAIRAWVYDTSPAVRDTMPNGREKDGKTFKDSDSDLFKHLIKKEYLRAELTPPNRYLSPEEIEAKRSDAGPGTDPVDPAQQLRRMVEGAAKVSAHFHAAEALQLVTSLAQRVTDQKNAKPFDHDRTAEYCARVADIALYIVRYLDGSVTDPVTDDIVSSYWTETDAEALP